MAHSENCKSLDKDIDNLAQLFDYWNNKLYKLSKNIYYNGYHIKVLKKLEEFTGFLESDLDQNLKTILKDIKKCQNSLPHVENERTIYEKNIALKKPWKSGDMLSAKWKNNQWSHSLIETHNEEHYAPVLVVDQPTTSKKLRIKKAKLPIIGVEEPFDIDNEFTNESNLNEQRQNFFQTMEKNNINSVPVDVPIDYNFLESYTNPSVKIDLTVANENIINKSANLSNLIFTNEANSSILTTSLEIDTIPVTISENNFSPFTNVCLNNSKTFTISQLKSENNLVYSVSDCESTASTNSHLIIDEDFDLENQKNNVSVDISKDLDKSDLEILAIYGFKNCKINIPINDPVFSIRSLKRKYPKQFSIKTTKNSNSVDNKINRLMSSTANLLKKGPASRIIISDDEEENPIDLLNVPTTSKSNFVKNKSYDQPISKKTKEKENVAKKLPSRTVLLSLKESSAETIDINVSSKETSVESKDSNSSLDSLKNEEIPKKKKRDLEADFLLRKNILLTESDEDVHRADSDIFSDSEPVVRRSCKKRKRMESENSLSEKEKILDVDNLRSNNRSTSPYLTKRITRQNSKSRSKQHIKNKITKKVIKPKRRRLAIDSEDDFLTSSDEEKNLEEKETEENQGDIQQSSVKKTIRFRRMMSKKQLAKETLDAEKNERERRKRLQAKQLEYNGVVIAEDHNTGEITLSVPGCSAPLLQSVTLDQDKNGGFNKCPVTIHPSLVRVLKPHQADGVKFLYENVIESLDLLDKPGGGGILAHCMGLGKTLQTITFLHTILTHKKISKAINKVMIVAPKNVVTNWAREFDKWLDQNDPELSSIEVNEISDYKTWDERLKCIKHWFNREKPSVLIIGYEMFQNLTKAPEDASKKSRLKAPQKMKSKKTIREEKMKVEFRKCLQDPGPDFVICDEGHKLKNDDTVTSKTMLKIATRRRLCLTGTPLQNNLIEYYTMVNFVKPGLLGTKQEYSNRFANIIKKGQTKDASVYEVKSMKRRCCVLFEQLSYVLHRRDYRVLIETIPPKQEYVIYIRLTQKQIDLYNEFLNNVSNRRNILPDYHILSRIWTHPYQLIDHERQVERKRFLCEDDNFVVSGSQTPESIQGESSSENNDVVELNDDESDEVGFTHKQTNSERKSRRQMGEEPDIERAETPVEYTGWFAKNNLVSEDDKYNFELSNKFVLLIEIIKRSEGCGDKLLVFTQSLESLRSIRRMLEYMSEKNLWFIDGHEALKTDGEVWGWAHGLDYLVIDGSVHNKVRDSIQQRFNNPLNLRSRLMLVSTRAGSLGTNLVSANRVVIFDACWNPSHDTQALFRVYRYGQIKPVYIYRFIAQGTMEEAIYRRQVTKEATAKRVTEEAQIQRHFSGHDLDELYEFNPKPYLESNFQAPRMAPPKDRLLGEIIRTNEPAIESYLQHDSLFDELEEEKLTEKERKEAWEDYNREKSGRPDPVQLAIANLKNGIHTDILYYHCLQIKGMTQNIAEDFVFLKRCLDTVQPSIPDPDFPGFANYFTQIIESVMSSNENVSNLLVKMNNTFKTVVDILSNEPQCRTALENLKLLNPGAFQNVV